MNLSCFRSLHEYEQMRLSVDGVRSFMSYYVIYGETPAASNGINRFLSPLYIVRMPLYALLMLVSLVGNGLVLLVICTNRFMLVKPTNYFMLNLAVCDLAMLASCVWVEMIASVHRHWFLGDLMCKVTMHS